MLTGPWRLARRSIEVARSDGWRLLLGKAWRRLRGRSYTPLLDAQYRRWLARQQPDGELDGRCARALRVEEPPRLLFVAWPAPGTIPAATRPALPHAAADALSRQPYPHWKLCVLSRAQDAAAARPRSDRDARIRLVATGTEPPAATVNRIVTETPASTHLAFLDPGDRLAVDAVPRLAEALTTRPADVLYTDEDQWRPGRGRRRPRFKPAWSPELLLSYDYLGHLTVYRTALFAEIGGLRARHAGALEYDLALRASERTTRIHHLPWVLCHRGADPGGHATVPAERPQHEPAARAALADALARRGVAGTVARGRLPDTWRVRARIDPATRVTILVPTRDRPDLLGPCIDSLERHTSGVAWELTVIDNGTRPDETRRLVGARPHRIVDGAGPFDYSALHNRAVRRTDADYLVFLNDDTRVTPGWLLALLEAAALPGVGAAGGLLLYPHGTVQHAGIVLGIGTVAGHSHKHFPAHEPGYLGSIQTMRNYAAVTGACLAVRRSVFLEVGGFDEALPCCFQDVDLCLRLGAAGYRTVYTPYCVVVHEESATRSSAVDDAEVGLVTARWGETLAHDRYYHPLLTRTLENFEMAACTAAGAWPPGAARGTR